MLFDYIYMTVFTYLITLVTFPIALRYTMQIPQIMLLDYIYMTVFKYFTSKVFVIHFAY